MKKIFTLTMMLMLIATMAIHAQKFEFKYKGEVLANGSTLSINAETDMFGELACETNPSTAPENGLIVAGKNGTYISGKAHLAILEHTFKAKTVQWCMGGSCETMKTVNELDKTFEGSAVQVMFDSFTIRAEGYLLAKLDVTVSDETQSLYIEFSNGHHSGVHSLEANEENADVYDLSGRLIMANANASARQLLRPGIYTIKKGNKARKVLVK